MKYIWTENGINYVFQDNKIVFETANFRQAVEFMKGLK